MPPAAFGARRFVHSNRGLLPSPIPNSTVRQAAAVLCAGTLSAPRVALQPAVSASTPPVLRAIGAPPQFLCATDLFLSRVARPKVVRDQARLPSDRTPSSKQGQLPGTTERR